jgi:hypothetical protein
MSTGTSTGSTSDECDSEVSYCRVWACSNFGIKRNRMELDVSVMLETPLLIILEVTGSILCSLKGAMFASFCVLSCSLSTVIFYSALYNVFSRETAVKYTKS